MIIPDFNRILNNFIDHHNAKIELALCFQQHGAPPHSSIKSKNIFIKYLQVAGLEDRAQLDSHQDLQIYRH